ncbi:MAG TPA: ribosome silencing factor [Steroidobacteraceae bacterium]|jgi:ribosome-associated protein|nr:ribosome silencing factor [Steroidobacteraceae bacterium]
MRRKSALESLVIAALDEMKAVNIKVLDVRGLTDFADAMVIASGNSDRHVRAIAQHVVDRAREQRRRPMGVEGGRDGEWVLVDLQDVVVHVMLPRVREFYAIEQLWEQPSVAASTAAAAATVASAPGAGSSARPRPTARAKNAAPRARRVRSATR